MHLEVLLVTPRENYKSVVEMLRSFQILGTIQSSPLAPQALCCQCIKPPHQFPKFELVVQTKFQQSAIHKQGTLMLKYMQQQSRR